MNRKLTLLILFTVLVGASAFSAFTLQGPIEPLEQPPSAETGEAVNETPELWFVEMSSLPLADGGRLSSTQRDKRNFRAEARRAGLVLTERYAFDTLWNGISVRVEPRDVGRLSRIPGVSAIYPILRVALPENSTEPSPELFTALQMTGADIAQSELGYTGEGIKVAVMDTGIDYDHPDLGGCFGPGCRVEFGYDLVGDAFSGAATDVPAPDSDPDDCAGHGTHVAGIVGANGEVIGVAPEVTFGAYRVFGCTGTTWTDIMLAAMEKALADNMDILNMSIGSAYTWPQYPTAAASDRLVNLGMVVVASIGNSGSNGLYAAGAPGLGRKVIGTAAFNNTHVTYPIFEVTGQDIVFGPMEFSGPAPRSGTEVIVYVGRACNSDMLSADPSGKVALIVRGTCTFREKALHAINAGATGVVVYNNLSGFFTGTLSSPIGDQSVPVVSISNADGLYIQGLEPVEMTWTDRVTQIADPSGGLIAAFSSYGLSPDLSVKPDIGAPGGSIYSTFPLELGEHAQLSGTSMASPHIAGAVALLLQAKPNTPAQVVRDILQNSADPKPWSGNPGLGFLDNVHRQGAGLVDIDDAILATTKITPGKIATGEGEAGPFVQVLRIENNAVSDVTYDLSFVNALSTGGVITPSFFLSNATVEFDAPEVLVPGHGVAFVTATIHPATLPVNGQYGGYIVFTPQGGGQVYRVPFAGFVGDYQGIQILTPTPNGFPWLARRSMGSFVKLNSPSDWTFTLGGEDLPYFLVHFDHQPEKFRMEIFNAQGKAFHRAYDDRYVVRNSTTTGFFALPFDGYTVNGKRVTAVPDGEYYAVISVLKANGDTGNPAHWEAWTSPNFVIDRP